MKIDKLNIDLEEYRKSNKDLINKQNDNNNEFLSLTRENNELKESFNTKTKHFTSVIEDKMDEIRKLDKLIK